MRALRWHGRGDLRLDDVPVPVPASSEVLIRVERVGICGTDIDEFVDGPLELPALTPHPISGVRTPLILGHEVVGRVVEDVSPDCPAGTLVIPDVVVACGQCPSCRRNEPGLCPSIAVRGLQMDGGLAEFMVAERRTLVRVPAHVDADVAAFAEPLSVAVRAERKAGDLAGRSVAVVGAGTIGLLLIQLLAGTGARSITAVDPSPTRRALAATLGADVVTEPAEHIGCVDVVFECAGTPAAVDLAFQTLGRGGTLVLVGTGQSTHEIPLRGVILREQRILGSAAHVWDVDVAAAVALLARAAVDPRPLLSGVIPLAAAVAEGFVRLSEGSGALKLLIDPSR